MKIVLLVAWTSITLGYAFLRTPSDPWAQFIVALVYGGFSLWIGYSLRKPSA
jgi:hypothetical protein